MCSNALCRGITDAAMHLHGPVGGLAAQPVGPEVTHRNLVGEPVCTENLNTGVVVMKSAQDGA